MRRETLYFDTSVPSAYYVKEKGSIRYYSKLGWNNLIRVDYHGSKEVPKGTCHTILKAAGIKK